MIVPEDPTYLRYFINEELFAIDENIPQPSQSIEVERPPSELLVISEPLTTQTRNTLQKLINALNLPKEKIEIHESWKDSFKANKVLIFGFTEQGPEIPQYFIKKEENTEFLRSESLDTLEGDRDKKVQLWNKLKEWFEL